MAASVRRLKTAKGPEENKTVIIHNLHCDKKNLFTKQEDHISVPNHNLTNMTQSLLSICLHLVRLESAGLGKIVINSTNNSLKTSDESGPRDNLIPEICLFVLQGEKDKRQLIHKNE